MCGDRILGKVIELTCKHYYDIDCFIDMVLSGMSEESYPPRCCGDPVPVNRVYDYLDAELVDFFEIRATELSTPNRVYCAVSSCARFLGPKASRREDLVCTCGASTCAGCRRPAHAAHVRCKDELESLQAVITLGQKRGWQRCPSCKQLVERSDGCDHMTCRCRAQFCFLCSAPWKTCSCMPGGPQTHTYKITDFVVAPDPVIGELHFLVFVHH